MNDSLIYKPEILKGKTAFVTGGSSGIGNGIARRLAMVGADIVIASRRKEKCEAAAKEIAEEYGVRALGLELDVRDSARVNAVFREAAETMGGLDILVNNAAGNFYFPAQKLRDKLWNAVIDIDLNGTFYCCRAAFKYLKEKGGSIISISATLQKDGWVGMAPAVSAKAAIDGLTKTLALEWGRFDIRVNAICPGPIVTEGVSKAFEKGGNFEDQSSLLPIARTGKVEEIGDLAVYMCSPAASWMTGSIVILDGGESIAAKRAGIDPEELEKMLSERKKG